MAANRKFRFAFCNEFCGEMPLEQVFSLAARLGYDGVEIAPFTLAETVADIRPEQRRKIADSAAAAGIEIAGLHWLLVSPGGLYINHPHDPELRRRTVEYLIELIDFCADIGGKILVFGSPKQRNVLPGASFEETWDHTVTAFRRCMPQAAARNVTVCIEPLSPRETNFITNHRQAIQLVQAVASPNFRMILDVKAMCSETLPIPQIIRESAPYLAHFHANDPNLRGPGFGDLDFRPILQALLDIDYRGFVSVEVFNFEPDGETIARKSLETLMAALPE